MKQRVLPVLAMTGALAAAGFAQSSDNVEKAVRFRVTPIAPVVVTSTSASDAQSQPQQVNEAELNSSAQLSELGPRWRWWNAEQLDELGPRWAIGWTWNTAQLDELGPRWKWWNAEQLDELGPRWKWWNAEQLEELGGNTKRGTAF